MSWGDSFVSAWNNATIGARATASALATGAKMVSDGTAATVQHLAREAQVMAKTAADMAEATGQATAKAAKTVARKTEDTGKWALQEGEKAGRTIATTAVAAKNITFKGVAAVYKATKQAFSTAVAGAAKVGCALENWVVGGITLSLGSELSKPGISDLLRPLLRNWGDKSQKSFDGQVFGSGCQENSPHGMMPTGCFQKPGFLPKITYVNGINTGYTPEHKGSKICTSMLEIAKSTCAEVTGVYNATEGIGRDVDECLDNIAKTRNSPSIVPLRDMMVKAARTGQPLLLFAHSQGGLITQQAVAKAKQQLMNEDGLTMEQAEEALRFVSIKSFGTALMGWPSGPHYERFTNTADPIPPVIIGAQTSYPIATLTDSATADQSHVFTSPHLNPINSHSMDDTYLPKFRELKGGCHCVCKSS